MIVWKREVRREMREETTFESYRKLFLLASEQNELVGVLISTEQSQKNYLNTNEVNTKIF